MSYGTVCLRCRHYTAEQSEVSKRITRSMGGDPSVVVDPCRCGELSMPSDDARTPNDPRAKWPSEGQPR